MSAFFVCTGAPTGPRRKLVDVFDADATVHRIPIPFGESGGHEREHSDRDSALAPVLPDQEPPAIDLGHGLSLPPQDQGHATTALDPSLPQRTTRTAPLTVDLGDRDSANSQESTRDLTDANDPYGGSVGNCGQYASRLGIETSDGDCALPDVDAALGENPAWALFEHVPFARVLRAYIPSPSVEDSLLGGYAQHYTRWGIVEHTHG